MKVKDLIRLLLLSAPKQIGLLKLREMFETCHTPAEVAAWVDKVQEEEIKIGPIREVLEVIYDLQKNDTEPPEISVVRMKLKDRFDKQVSKIDLKSLIESMKVFVPGFISVEGDKVGIQGHPDKILEVIHSAIVNVPNDLQGLYLTAFSHDSSISAVSSVSTFSKLQNTLFSPGKKSP